MSRLVPLAVAALLAAGCGGAPAPAPVPVTTAPVVVPTSPVPVVVPGRVVLGPLELGRPRSAAVEVRPANRPVSFGRTELRGSAAWELTGDTCGRRTLRPADPPCRLEITVLGRSTGDLAATLVLPWNRGRLSVPLTASVPVSYTVLLTVRGAGSVTGDRAGISCSDRCTARVTQGAELTLTASGSPRWSGDCTGTAPTCRVTVDTPLDITAEFG